MEAGLAGTDREPSVSFNLQVHILRGQLGQNSRKERRIDDDTSRLFHCGPHRGPNHDFVVGCGQGEHGAAVVRLHMDALDRLRHCPFGRRSGCLRRQSKDFIALDMCKHRDTSFMQF